MISTPSGHILAVLQVQRNLQPPLNPHACGVLPSIVLSLSGLDFFFNLDEGGRFGLRFESGYGNFCGDCRRGCHSYDKNHARVPLHRDFLAVQLANCLLCKYDLGMFEADHVSPKP